uniref:Semaphorin-5A-like n=1 Tax=Crassostrea virginica TaxID=6565 RepID=A0A8B8A6C8_CRAVI|nr:semaphorin-5A-like [Crassostrea virginica]
MPCPVDHIDCVDNSCTCSLKRITTTPPPTTTTTTTIDGHWSDWMHWSSCSATCGIGTKTRLRICNNPAPLNGGENCFGNVSEMQYCDEAICQVGPECPTCDVDLNCHWNSVCDVSEVCMIRSYRNTTFSVHCTKREDCDFIKAVLPNAEIFCCNNRSCLTSKLGLS